jgi:hypothetical protein
MKSRVLALFGLGSVWLRCCGLPSIHRRSTKLAGFAFGLYLGTTKYAMTMLTVSGEMGHLGFWGRSEVPEYTQCKYGRVSEN